MEFAEQEHFERRKQVKALAPQNWKEPGELSRLPW
jgi:hypothetical protein